VIRRVWVFTELKNFKDKLIFNGFGFRRMQRLEDKNITKEARDEFEKDKAKENNGEDNEEEQKDEKEKNLGKDHFIN